jgi:hypothetical protein
MVYTISSALFGMMEWTDIYDLPPYEHRCDLLRLETLVKSAPSFTMVYRARTTGRMNATMRKFDDVCSISF